eukprot:TRINITY_DN13667_c0_g1_i1.p1 TRINITY_DN13667_c0_g1~~TRINITY_DN13667_c0_g1_i1.p1  ORF type:complete len:323 (+),score=79.78 TRINITY_DN13667_c0_g1_i1:838-1806(+)
MVKSYNRKGFGFIMCLENPALVDIYYTREQLSTSLQTRDIPGQHVTFELVRFPDGKMTAKHIRPLGEEMQPAFGGKSAPAKGSGMQQQPFGCGKGGYAEEEDRSRDWHCPCGERNFVRRGECYKCGRLRNNGFSDAPSTSTFQRPERRTFSPHAGARAIRDALRAGRAAQQGGFAAGSRSRSRGRRRSSDSSSKSRSSSSSEKSKTRKKKKNKSKKKKKKRSRSSSESSSSSKSSDEAERGAAAAQGGDADKQPGNPEVEKAKSEALETLMKLRKVEPKETRMSEFRALLRTWHPDKNPQRLEVATAVFQFLQKGKSLLETG